MLEMQGAAVCDLAHGLRSLVSVVLYSIIPAMAKDKTIYTCNECGGTSPKWLGKCPHCEAWNTLVESRVSDTGASKNRYSDRAGLAPASSCLPQATKLPSANAMGRANRRRRLRSGEAGWAIGKDVMDIGVAGCKSVSGGRVGESGNGSRSGYFTGTLCKAPVGAGFGACKHSYPQSGTQFSGVNRRGLTSVSSTKPNLENC